MGLLLCCSGDACDLQGSKNTAQAPKYISWHERAQRHFSLQKFFDKENFCVKIAFGSSHAKNSTSSLCSVTFAVLPLPKAKMRTQTQFTELLQIGLGATAKAEDN